MVHICAFPTCHISRTKKYSGISLFQFPKRKAEFYTTWRKNLLDVLCKYRVMDAAFKREVMESKVILHMCERHFVKEDIELTPTGIKTLKLQALPTINLPERTLESPKPVERRQIQRMPSQEHNPSVIVSQHHYQDFVELCKRVERCKLDGWAISITNTHVNLTSHLEPHIVPQYEITIDDSLGFTIVVFGWLLPETHTLYKKYYRSIRNVTVSTLLAEIKQYHLCPGLNIKSINTMPSSSTVMSHVIPCHIDLQGDHTTPIVTTQYNRHEDCFLLLNSEEACTKCDYSKRSIDSKVKKVKPLHPNAPLSKTSRVRLIETVKMQRIENQELKKRLQQEIAEKSICVDNELAGDFDKIMTENSENITPFMRLFWEQQKQSSITKGTSNRYHPMIIRFCLSLASKSASAYDELRTSNVLTLPSRRTLRDYKNAIKPHSGFNPAVIEELIKTTKPLEGYKRNVCLSFDEMKIQENLVYDKYSGDLVGYVDLGDPDINYSSFKNADELASHVMVFYIRGLASDLKFELGYFGTRGMLSYQIMGRFWQAVSILEDNCDLHVIAAVSDGASSNRSFYKMHQQMSGTDNSEVVYRTENIFRPGYYICFFADAPHLMKTTRNCIYHSGGGKHTRLLWNNGKEIVWKHFARIVEDQLSLKFMVKLSDEHIHLNPYSAMNVRLATQILSESVGKVLLQRYPEAHATGELCLHMDKFFDILNVRNESEGVRKRKTFLSPFCTINDERFSWLQNEFLPYLQSWKSSVETREGNFGRVERNKMFLSHQTYEGILISVNSIIETVKFLINDGMKYVLTERLNQDVAEENFGRHRGVGRRNENPSLHQFGYDSNTLRMARSIVPMRGNTSGVYNQKRKVSWAHVDNAPLPKRR